jgi:hypothetical protein
MHAFVNDISARKATRVVTRRMCFARLIACFPMPAFARLRLGDEEWMRHFRAFVRTFIAFIEVLNDGKFDLSRWNAMRVAWKEFGYRALK